MEVNFGQSILDIAIMQYGTIEGVLPLAQDNQISITQKLNGGDILQIKQTIIREDIVNYFKAEKFVINTGTNENTKEFNKDFNNDFA